MGASSERWVFLAETGYPYSEMLSDLLRQHGIPYTAQGSLGAGMALKVGPCLERTRFYVPGDFLDRARALFDTISPLA